MNSNVLDKAMDVIVNDQPFPTISRRKAKKLRLPKSSKSLKAVAASDFEKKPKKVCAPKPPNLPKPVAPDYKQDKEGYFLYLINEVKYEKFANDTQAISKNSIKRGLMEYLWQKTLRYHFDHWKGDAPEGMSKKQVLKEGNKQVSSHMHTQLSVLRI